MSNVLNNGAVLPSGLLGNDEEQMMEGFNKSYKNFPLRVGVVVASYPVSDDNNRSKLTTEYDVAVIEQQEDKGSTIIGYKNCMSSEGMGAIADFFEKALRYRKKKTTKGNSTNLKGQNGAVVLLLCLDGMSDKGIIISALTHPDRKTKLTSTDPYLEGEYNGVNIKVATDGSATFAFRGATDNDGKVIDPSQGTTTLKVEKDGSFQVDHDTITLRLGRNGTASLTAKKDVTITADGNITIVVKGNASVKCANASVDASGTVDVKSGGDANVNVGGTCKVKAGGKATIDAAQIELNGSGGQVLTTLTDPIVDLITGVPTMGVPKVKAG